MVIYKERSFGSHTKKLKDDKTMKRIVSFLLLTVLVLSLASCGEVKPLDLSEVNLSKYVTVSDYMGISVEIDAQKEVTDDDVKAVVDKLLSDNATTETETVTDRSVADGDTVDISFKGYIDDVEFEGGSAENETLVIGSDSYIDGFEDGLIGANIGETVSVDATFPDEYKSNPDLAGKTARFDVTVNSISLVKSVLPEYTDEFVKANTDYETIAEYENAVREDLVKSNEETYDNAKISAVWYAIIDKAVFNELPAKNVEYQIQKAKDSIEYQKTLLMYYYGLDQATADALFTYSEDDLRESAEETVREELVFWAIVRAENYEITDEEYTAALNEYATNNSTTVDVLESNYSKDVLTEAFLWDKVLETLADNATVIEK